MAQRLFDKDCGCKGCSFALRLEAERNDQSWKLGRGQVSTENPRKRTGNKQDRRDLMMFHAGRYQMGARDTSAVKANADFRLLMQLN